MRSHYLNKVTVVISFLFLAALTAVSVRAHSFSDTRAASPSLNFSHQSDVEFLKNQTMALLQQVKADPTNRTLLAQLAEAYRSIGEESRDTAYVSQSVDLYLRASKLGQNEGRILYTGQIADLLIQLGDRRRLDQFFEGILSLPSGDQGERFVALVDYADALAKFKDNRAWSYFEEAIASRTDSNIEAYNRYAQALIDQGSYSRAVEILDRLSPDERIAAVVPASLRMEALSHLGMADDAALEEVQTAQGRFTNAVVERTGGRPSEPSSGPLAKFSHSSSMDDCRSPGNSIGCVDDGHGLCWYYFVVNLAELMWNEAHTEKVGAQDLVGWTVRDRALESLSCDAYPGGIASACRSTVPCSGGVCDISEWYCCVIHGGTTTVGASQSQFNDAHVSMSTLYSSGLIIRAGDMVNGRAPELSTSWISPGISGCSTSCTTSHCTSGFNNYDPSPHGPMEYRGHNYCTASSTLICKTATGNVCGDSAYTSNCNTTVTSDNFFWNRK